MDNKQSGFSLHMLLPLIIIVVVGGIGVLTLMRSQAAVNLSSNQESKLIATEENIKDDGPSDTGYAELEEDVKTTTTSTIENDSASTLNLKIASWNVYKYNNKDVSANVKRILRSVDILGIQEGTFFGNKLLKKVACPTCSYDMYPRDKGTPKKIALIWSRSKFTLLSSGYKHLSTQNNVKKYVVWVKLRENSSHKVFYVMNTHSPFSATTTTGGLQKDSNGAAYKTHMTMLAQKISMLQADGLPIFLTGDLNADFRTDKCTTSALPCQSLSSDLSIKSGWQYLQLKGVKRTTGTASSKRIIDYVMSWNLSNVTYKSMNILYGGAGKGWGGSDHKPVVLSLTIGNETN